MYYCSEKKRDIFYWNVVSRLLRTMDLQINPKNRNKNKFMYNKHEQKILTANRSRLCGTQYYLFIYLLKVCLVNLKIK